MARRNSNHFDRIAANVVREQRGDGSIQRHQASLMEQRQAHQVGVRHLAMTLNSFRKVTDSIY